jgi:glycosyltransferase involved in cell wall biosynthesis
MYVVESFAGGALMHVRQMASEMHRRGWQISIVHSRRSDTPLDFARLFPPATEFIELAWARTIDPAADARAILTLRRVMTARAPAVIHLASSKAGMGGRLAAWPRFRDRVVYSPMGWSFLQRDRGLLRRCCYWALEWVAARFGGIIVACSRGEQELGRWLSRRGRCVLIENAAAPAADVTARWQGGLNPAGLPLIVGTVGRICAAKDPAFFVDVARIVSGRSRAVRFVWIGDGEERPILEAARRQGLPIEITGWLPPEAVIGRLCHWTVYLQTSQWEGMPLGALEALSVGLPVVARDVVGCRDAIRDGVTGCLFRTPAEAAEGVWKFLTEPAAWQAASQAARQEALNRFSVTRLGQQLEQLYTQVSARG